MEIIDWTVKKYDVLNTRYIFNYIEYVTKLLEKERMSHTIDKTQSPRFPVGSYAAKREYQAIVNQHAEQFERDTAAYDTARTEEVRLTALNVTMQADRQKQVDYYQDVARHNIEVQAGRPSPYGWSQAQILIGPPLPIALHAVPAPVAPQFAPLHAAFDRTHEGLIKEYEKYKSDCLIATNLIEETLDLNSRLDIRMKTIHLVEPKDKLLQIWEELMKFKGEALRITADITAEMHLIRVPSCILDLRDIFSQIDQKQQELLQIGPLHVVADTELIKIILIKISGLECFRMLRISLHQHNEAAQEAGGTPFTWVNLKRIVKAFMLSDEPAHSSTLAPNILMAGSAETDDKYKKLEGLCDTLQQQVNTLVNVGNSTSRYSQQGQDGFNTSRVSFPQQERSRSRSKERFSDSTSSQRQQQQRQWNQPQYQQRQWNQPQYQQRQWNQPQQQQWNQPQQQSWNQPQQQMWSQSQQQPWNQFQQQSWNQPQQQPWTRPQQQSSRGRGQGRGSWSKQSGPFRVNHAEADDSSWVQEGENDEDQC